MAKSLQPLKSDISQQEKPGCRPTAFSDGPVNKQRRTTMPEITFRVSASSRAGEALAHARQVITDLNAGRLMVYKVGVTKDPYTRWSNKSYGYKHDKAFNKQPLYEGMMILLQIDSSAAAAFAEAGLIAMFLGKPGNMNQALGGEGMRDVECNHYIYVVYGYCT